MNEFNIVPHLVKGSIRINSLYTFIVDLLQENKLKLNVDCTHSNNPDRNAYFFELSIVQPISLFSDGFVAKSRHLTIDQIYSVSTQKTGFSLAHYTEQYERADGQKIVVHAYYDRQGNVSHIQVKRNEVVDQSITQDMYAQIKTNAVTATQKLLTLIEEKDAKYLTLYEEAAALEKKLVQIFKQKNLRLFKDTAEKYISTLEAMNRYCDDNKDVRHKIIKNLLADTEQTFTTSQQLADNLPSEATELGVDDVELVNTKVSYQELSMQQKYQAMFTKIQANITQKYNKLLQLQQKPVQELDVILEQHKVAKEIEELQIELWYLSAKYKITLTEVELPGVGPRQSFNAANHMIDLKQFFKEQCLKLDLNGVQKIYEYIKGGMFDKEYLLDLLLDLCKLIEDQPECDIANILRFLFENINIYRNILANKENSCSLLFASSRVNDILVSPIMITFLYKKFQLLELFLEYTLNPAHTIGLAYSDKLIPLAKAIAAFGFKVSAAEFTLVMQKLFKDNEHLVAVPYIHKELPASKVSRKEIAQFLRKSSKRTIQYQDILNDDYLQLRDSLNQQVSSDAKIANLEHLLITRGDSILEVIFYDYVSLEHLEIETVRWLAEKSDLMSLLLILGKMLNQNDIAMRLMENSYGDADISICKTSVDADLRKLSSDFVSQRFDGNSGDDLQQSYGISLIFFLTDTSKKAEIAKNNFVRLADTLLKVLFSKLQQMPFDVLFTPNTQGVFFPLFMSTCKNVVDNQISATIRSCMILLISYIRVTKVKEIKDQLFNYLASTICSLANYYFHKHLKEPNNLNITKTVQYYCDMVINMTSYYPYLKDKKTYREVVQLKDNIESKLSAQSTTMQPKRALTFANLQGQHNVCLTDPNLQAKVCFGLEKLR